MGVGGQHRASVTLPQGKKPGNHCTGGWVGPKADMDGCGKSRLHTVVITFIDLRYLPFITKNTAKCSSP
jgi:hypothetical protein